MRQGHHPIRHVAQGHATYKGRVHIGFYYEAEDNLRVPTAAKKLIIRIVYDGKVWMMSHRQFEEWFGVSEEESGMWQGRAESNTVMVERQ